MNKQKDNNEIDTAESFFIFSIVLSVAPQIISSQIYASIFIVILLFSCVTCDYYTISIFLKAQWPCPQACSPVPGIYTVGPQPYFCLWFWFQLRFWLQRSPLSLANTFFLLVVLFPVQPEES